MKDGYVFDQDGPEVFADVSASEATGIGYVAGGTLLAGRAVVLDPASNETHLLGDPVFWVDSTIRSAGAVIYANAGTKPLLGLIDFSFDRTSENGLFRL